MLARVWVVVQHVPYDGAGGVTGALQRAGERAVHLRPYAGDPLPRAAELTGLVVLGGPTGTADGDTAHLVAERTLLREAAERGLPVLGVCFGAQLLAVALGGAVRRAPQPEVGMSAVRLTAAGRADPVLGPAGDVLPVLQWHRDVVGPPPGARSLAVGDDQAFRFGRRAYGLQFHVEIDPPLGEVVRPQLPGVDLGDADVERASRCGAAVLDRFLALR